MEFEIYFFNKNELCTNYLVRQLHPFNIVDTPPIITAIDNAIPESIILNNPKANIITLIIGNNFSMQLFI